MPSIPSNSIVTLTSTGLLKVSGERARDLLQGQLTCDLNEVTETETRLGAHCNPQGRIISLFRVMAYQNAYYLLMPNSLVSIALNALKKYAVFFKVSLEDMSDQFEYIGYYGNELAKIMLPIPDEVNQMTQTEDGIVIKLAAERYEIIGNLSLLKKSIIPTMSENDWKYLAIQAGTPAIYPETSEKLLPHEINLHLLHGISFNKGCYTGQEIIARMQYRGKLKTALVSVTEITEIPPKLGDKIVDFCKTGNNSYQMLMIVNKQDAQQPR